MSIHYKMAEQVGGQVHMINAVLGQLEWDLFTRTSKVAGSSSAEQVRVTQRIAHGILSSDCFGDYIERALAEVDALTPWQSCNLSLLKDMHVLAKIVPLSLIETINNCRLECFDLWNVAVANNDYGLISASFNDLLRHTREYLTIKSEFLKINSLYDAALRSFEPDMSSLAIDGFFAHIGKYMAENLGKIIEGRKRIKYVRSVFATSKQEELMSSIVHSVFKDKLNIGAVVGNFIERSFYDRDVVMISTNLSEADLSRGTKQVMRHIGHSLFYVGRDEARIRQPAGIRRGQVMSEAIASIFGVHVASTREFATFVQPTFKRLFASRNKGWDIDECMEALGKGGCSLHRLDCDELFSMAHLMMRYSIEKELLVGNLSVDDLPDAWREGSRRYFKSVPKSSMDGCLQDEHWYRGIFGYFPVQAVGIMLSSGLSEVALSTEGVLPGIEGGDFAPMLSWIQSKIIDSAPNLYTQEVFAHATGDNFRVSGYLGYLQKKYGV